MKTQQLQVLELLKTQGEYGVNSYDLTYKYNIKQGPTRIKELKQLGFVIVSKQNANRSVNYILRSRVKPDMPQQVDKWEFDQNGFAREKAEPRQESFL